LTSTDRGGDDDVMVRALFIASLCVVSSWQTSSQAFSVLRVKVVLADADRHATPVPHHVLLVSDNPASAAPRQMVTAVDGTAELRVRPGKYTVESDRPVTFHGKAYQWTQMVEVAAGRDTLLELTAENADVAPATSAPTPGAPALEADPSFLLPQWQDSVVAIWTPSARASAFVIDARGLIATNQRVIGAATTVEVQLTADIKVAARVLAADAAKDVTVLWIDPMAAASLRPVPLGCGQAARPTVAVGQELFTIGAPFGAPKDMTSGSAVRVEAHAIASDFRLPTGSAGGPVFAAAGAVVGITSPVGDHESNWRGTSRVVRIEDACDVVALAETKMKNAAPPVGTHLPMEPERPFPVEALAKAAQGRAGSLKPYQVSSSDFDIAFITPVLVYGAEHQADQVKGRDRGAERTPEAEAGVRPLMDFGNWSEYVADYPPVLLIRATPRLVEGFWTTVARGAAATQGVALPPIKRYKPGFSRMRAFCGDAEVTPIHPFRLEQRVSDSDAIYEGLYVFDPGALGPQCGAVKLVLFSEKEPEKGDTRVIDPKIVQQVWQDFAPYRGGR
jgi:S1-C subfamily serine protease